MPELTDSDTNIQHLRGLVFAPPDRSKTFSSATVSDKAPAWLTNVRPRKLAHHDPITLDDLLWIAFDSGATVGMKQQGLKVPQFDLSHIDMTKWDAENIELQRKIKERVLGGQTKVVIIDTVSAFDEMVQYRAEVIKGLVKFDKWGDVLTTHQKFAMPLKALPCHVIFLCHAKALVEVGGNSDASANQRKVRQAAGISGIIPAISGQSLNHYLRGCTFVFSVTKERRGGETSYWFNTEHDLFETKSRLILPDKFPADWREVRRVLEAGPIKEESKQ